MLKVLRMKDIKSKGNVRNEKDDDIGNLAKDIEKNGLLQPLVVREGKDCKYELIAGHRRLAALKILKEEFVECNVIEAGDADVVRMQMAENIQRKNMSAYELVGIFEKIGKSQAQIARMFNKSPAWVSQQYAAVRELEALYGKDIPEEAKKKSYSAILSNAHDKRTGEAEKINCKGFSVTHKGHCYKLDFDTFEAEKAFKKFIEGYRL